MRKQPTLSPTLRGMAAGTLFVMSVGAAAQTPAAPTSETVGLAFQRADGNGDGKLSPDEASRLPAIAEKFDALDKDRDGYLSLDEFAAAFTTPG
jgi:Ca2+-binding EF-hand superfamily protein